jgi:phosphoribosylglycinamide formyltransferase-1
MTTRKHRVGILISGRGSNMMALIEAARRPDYPAEIACVISNRAEADGLKKAQAEGVPAIAVDQTAFNDSAAFEAALDTELKTFGVDVIACAGFMRILSPAFVERWHDRMLNIHPSLLPAFKGRDTHERALQAGVKIVGCTVHVVRASVDDGPIIAQAAVPVLSGDTPERLAARVLEAEHRLYPHALNIFLSPQAHMTGGASEDVQATVNQEKALFWPPLPRAGQG